jgi:5-oxopent-3-ene-1,2,5-tricarboxylate decarboxylase/2-hydroxyhepta-2,4-diene-1,7-dioate isomerase
MKTARVAYSGAIHSATPLQGDDTAQLRLADGRTVAEADVVWLPPFEVGSIIALGLNYADHVKELAKELTVTPQDEPLVFLKGPGQLIGHRGHTRRPAGAAFMHYECELAVVIGRPAAGRARSRRHGACGRLHRLQRLRGARLPGELVPPQPAREEPRRRHRAGPLVRARRRGARPACAGLRTRVNGRITQQGSTAHMIHASRR